MKARSIIDQGVLKVAAKLAGDKWQAVIEKAYDSLIDSEKSPERALADILESYKLDGPVNSEAKKEKP